MGLGQRTAEDGEILAEDIDLAAVDGAPAGHHAIAGDLLFGHAEVRRAVRDEHVEFVKRAFVEQHLDALAGSKLAFRVLRIDAALAAAKARLLAALLQLFQNGPHQFSSRSARTRLPATK